MAKRLNFKFKCKVLDDEKDKKAMDILVDYLRGFLAELVGTFLYVYFGCLCKIQGGTGGSLCLGFFYGTIIQIFFTVNLGHINPVISLSYYIFGLVSLPKLFLFIIAQLLGAIIGAALLKEMTMYLSYSRLHAAYCCSFVETYFSIAKGFFWEFGMTCFLILVVCSIVDSRNIKRLDSIPLKYAFVMFVITYFGSGITGGVVNPARSFGAAVVIGYWEDHWIFWLAPILASALTSVVYHIFYLPEDGQDAIIELLKNAEKSDGGGGGGDD